MVLQLISLLSPLRSQADGIREVVRARLIEKQCKSIWHNILIKKETARKFIEGDYYSNWEEQHNRTIVKANSLPDVFIFSVTGGRYMQTSGRQFQDIYVFEDVIPNILNFISLVMWQQQFIIGRLLYLLSLMFPSQFL